MDAKELCSRCLEQASKVFHHLQPEDYNKLTPDIEWNVKVLANHMLYELCWIPDILSGRTIAEVGGKYDGDLVGTDPIAGWNKAAALAMGEIKLADLSKIVYLSFGNFPGEYYVRQVAGDLLIHSWDLAAALGVDRTLDPETAQAVYDTLSADKAGWQNSGLFAPELNVPADADIQTRLLALVGRDAAWQS